MSETDARSVHMWGFFDADGRPRLPSGAAPSALSVYAHHRNVEANIVRCGGSVHALRTTRTLDGWLVGTEFECPAHDRTARMWHQIVQPESEWRNPTTPAPTPTSAAVVAEES